MMGFRIQITINSIPLFKLMKISFFKNSKPLSHMLCECVRGGNKLDLAYSKF